MSLAYFQATIRPIPHSIPYVSWQEQTSVNTGIRARAAHNHYVPPRYVVALGSGLMSRLAELALRVLAKRIKLAVQILSFSAGPLP